MRIRQLGLTRFGRFTDRSINFGERSTDGLDLHVVYGPNEAGKSTAMAAVMDLFFGIGGQSRYNFIHPYPTMRIDGTVELASGPRRVSRIKRPQNSLLDDADTPLAETALAGDLGGLERAAYQTMFCLDDETLEAGGESILASKGDLGHLLFSASAGLADLSRRLDAVRAVADGFYRQGRRTGGLADLKKSLASLKDERDRRDTIASDYARLAAARNDASSKYEAAVAERSRIFARSEELQRVLSALPRLATYKAIQAELAALKAIPDPPHTWAADLPDLMASEIRLTTQAATANARVASVRAELDGLIVDEDARALSAGIELLSDQRARYITAQKDLPSRRMQLATTEDAVRRILASIGRAEEAAPERLVLSAAVTGTLRGLIERRAGIDGLIIAAESEIAVARRAVSAAEEDLNDDAAIAPGHAVLRQLALAVAGAHQDDAPSRLRAAEREFAKKTDELTAALLSLRPWQGTEIALGEIAVPPSDRIEQWAAMERELARDEVLHKADINRLEGETHSLSAKIEIRSAQSGIVSDHSASEVRGARETAWVAHRASFGDVTAAAFESAMRHDDLVSEQRLGHATGIAELNGALLELSTKEAELSRARAAGARAIAERRALVGEIQSCIQSFGEIMVSGLSVEALKAWLRKREHALSCGANVKAAEHDRRTADQDRLVLRNRVMRALRDAGLVHSDDADLSELAATGQEALDRHARRSVLTKSLEDRRREFATREAKLEDAVRAEQVWSEEWKRVCGSCWLGEDGTTPVSAVVKETLSAIAELGSEAAKRTELAGRIGKMECDCDDFGGNVRSLAAGLGLPEEADLLLDCQRIIATVARNEEIAKRRSNLTVEIEKENAELTTISVELSGVSGRKVQMTSYCGVETLAEVDRCLREAGRKAELKTRSSLEREEVLRMLAIDDFSGAEQRLSTCERGPLETELEENRTRLTDLESRCRELHTEASKASDAVDAIGGDAAVSVLDEKRRTVMLSIEDQAMHHLELRVGAAAADRGLRTYRDKHRGSMMSDASKAFTLLSRGAYSGLASQPRADGDILIANGADGSSKVASELSKGTRFQLYLALRVAGYHEFARSRAPAPFMADDIMETFDDFRAEEAFKLLAGMAGVGQVVYFTHHRHLCEIAKTVAPGVRIHAL